VNPQKGEAYPRGQGRLAQLEERLVCNQAAGGSNPPASTIKIRYAASMRCQNVDFWKIHYFPIRKKS
jgi:hypothetical protein